jgi:hypothetical protein
MAFLRRLTVMNKHVTAVHSVTASPLAALLPAAEPLDSSVGRRCYSGGVVLKDVLAAAIPAQQDRLKTIKAARGDKSVGDVTVNMAGGAMYVQNENVTRRCTSSHSSSFTSFASLQAH